jgi:hypothetical protein
MNLAIVNITFLIQLPEDSILWQHPELLIFLITVTTYLFGFLIYGGYLSAFAGSIGNTPFAFSDLTIVDLLAILPMAILTIINKIINSFWKVINFIVIYSFLPTFIGLLFRFSYPTIFAPPIASIAFLTGFILWIVVMLTVSWFDIRYKSWWFVLELFLAISSGILFWGGASVVGQTAIQPQTEGISLLNNLLYVIAFSFAMLAAFVLGIITAETVVERKALSKVSRIVLRQPLPLLGKAEQAINETNMRTTRKWLFQASVPVMIEPDVYTYSFRDEQVLYLVSTFRNFSLFFIPGNRKDEKINGHLLSISSYLIYSVELITRDRNIRGK